MIRKKAILLMFSLCTFLLVGCQQVVELTDEETELIAEYAAELLLKYDINYVDRIDEGNEKAEEMAKEELEQIMNGESTTEATTNDVSTESITTEKVETTEISTEEESDTKEDSTVDTQENPIGTEHDIAVIAGVEGANITFREYVIVDKYPATDEQGEFIYLEASEGYQLLVLQFDVVNTTSEVLPVSLIDTELDYRIVCNGTKAANPMLTILMDDLGTLETNIEPGTPQEAVLVFQISDGMQDELETMELYVTYNEMDNVIKILQ